MTRVELPALTRLIYRSVCAYVEALLTWIQNPLIQDVEITLFYQLILSVPPQARSWVNYCTIETSRPTWAQIDLSEASTRDRVRGTTHRLPRYMSERVVRANRLSGVRNGADLQWAARRRPHVRPPPEIPEEWRALLTPFRRLGTLRVHATLADDLECALRPQTGCVGGPLIRQGLDLLLWDLHTLVLMYGSDKHALTAASDALRRYGQYGNNLWDWPAGAASIKKISHKLKLEAP